MTTASYGNRTHVNSLEGYYANTTPTMLPLHQRCSHQELWLNNEKQTDWRSESKVQRENAAPKHLLTDDNCIVRESNPCQKLGRLLCYHYTNDAHMKYCDFTMKNSPLESKTDWQSESKSAERKRCTKTIANGWQLHRTGIEPMSVAWKATMLPLHQRYSHQELWLYNEKRSSCVKNWLTIGEKKCREKTLHQNNRQRITIASYGNRTHVNSLEGYYATTTTTMLTSRVVIIQWETVLLCQKLIDDRREKVQRENAAPKQSPTDYNCFVRELNPCQ